MIQEFIEDEEFTAEESDDLLNKLEDDEIDEVLEYIDENCDNSCILE